MGCKRLIINVKTKQRVIEEEWIYDNYDLPIGKALKAGMKGEYIPVEVALCGQFFINKIYRKRLNRIKVMGVN